MENLDLIMPDKCSEVDVLINGNSDHRLLKFIRHTKGEIRKPKFVTKRSYKKFNEESFLSDLKSLSWYDLYMTEDVNLATQIFKEKLTNILDIHTPKKTFQIRKNYAPWLSEELKDLCKKRDETLKKYKVTRYDQF